MHDTTNPPQDEVQQPVMQAESSSSADISTRKTAPISAASLGFAVNIVFSILAALVTVAAYQYFLAPKTPQIGTVDLVQIMEVYDAPALKAIKEGDLAAAHKAAEERAKVAVRLEKILEDMSVKEGVVFIQKQALIGTGVTDYTMDIMKVMEDAQ